MNIVKKISIGIAVVLALGVGIGFMLPRTAHVERSTTIDAPPATVFTVLNGFRQFNRWSPWADIDPNATTSYEGPETGVGAKMSWAGNAEVGTGSQEILESRPYEHIRVRLSFGDFPGEFGATYALAPSATGTTVTWGYDANYGGSIIGRYFGLLSERMLGPDYEKGLGRLKTLVESLPKADFSGLRIETVDTFAQPAVMVAGRSAPDARLLGVSLGVAYGRLSGYMSTKGLRQAAPPLAIFYAEEDGALKFDAAIPVDRADVEGDGAIRAGRTPAGRAVKAVYRGPYAGLAGAGQSLQAYLVAAGYRQGGPKWEEYVSDPGQTPDFELVTHIYYPVE